MNGVTLPYVGSDRGRDSTYIRAGAFDENTSYREHEIEDVNLLYPQRFPSPCTQVSYAVEIFNDGLKDINFKCGFIELRN